MSNNIGNISSSGEDFSSLPEVKVTEPKLPETLQSGETSEIKPSLAKSDTTAGKLASFFSNVGKGAATTVGVPIAVFGKLVGGAIGGTTRVSGGVAGALGAGMGWIASGVTGGDKDARKIAALKGEQIASASTAFGVGVLLTPLNVPFKFIENFGKALIPKDAKPPECYTKFNDAYKTNVLPFLMTIGKKAVQEQKAGFDIDKTAIFKAYDKAKGQIKDIKEKAESAKKTPEEIESESEYLKTLPRMVIRDTRFGNLYIIDKDYYYERIPNASNFSQKDYEEFQKSVLEDLRNQGVPSPHFKISDAAVFLNDKGELESTEDQAKIEELRKDGKRIRWF